MWGGYAVLFIQTYPDDQGGITNAALASEVNRASTFPGNGTVIRPGSRAQFIMVFKTNIPANVSPELSSLPGGQGYVYGPLPWESPISNDSSYDVQYAIFTFSFCFKGGCFYSFGPYGNAWLSGPQGNISRFMDTNRYAGLESLFQGGVGTVIPEIQTAGNYTLHYFNNYSGNVTGKVAMGWSVVVFSRSRPYLYAGWATVASAAAFSTITGLVYLRKLRPPPANASSNSRQPTTPPGPESRITPA